ncbi:MAG: N-formylglutamate amidohydrolase [Myxococcota bacterium]|nr:N-formylglutamate amidohydrolase [Myxococcota bacterium]
MTSVFSYSPPQKRGVPILISVPHAGTAFPEEWSHGVLQSPFQTHPPDTDWFVDKLYTFAPELGIGVIKANLSRYVVDLNRDPKAKPLYSDGRLITGPIPLQSFEGKDLYRDPPSEEEKKTRIRTYFQPYHNAIQAKLAELKERHESVLLFDAHSIRHHVPKLHAEPFPDLILGNNDQKTASPQLIEACWEVLRQSTYTASHNSPFKGGYITRHYGHPQSGIHTLQLEMSQRIYMDEERGIWDVQKASSVQQLLRIVFQRLIEAMA